jgi:very-short-patch-repair endonuclease
MVAHTSPHPGAARHPSPSRGEGKTGQAAPSLLPSPLEGEGASRSEAGEGASRPTRPTRPPATPRMRVLAKTLRANATEAERLLWGIVRDRRLDRHKFRRQVPIGPFIVDLFCPEAKLVLELDGSQHAEDPTDTRRDAWLKAKGYRVLRIWNNELTSNRDGVLEAIWTAVRDSSPHPGAARHPSPSRGEGKGDDHAR